MLSLKRELKKNLDSAKRVAVLGIGSSLRGDDALGEALIGELKQNLKKKKLRIALKLFSCGVVPENFTGEIKRFKPDLILIVDALDMGKETGQISIIDPEETSSNVSFSTHGLPLNLLIDYLTRSLDCRIICIGIQPKSVGLGVSISSRVDKAIKKISNFITENIVD
jgi:hydrogenase 3 maturation protease